ncbi:hypothetical protein ACFUTR_05350 [Streptomyces sp. NPDC057367]
MPDVVMLRARRPSASPFPARATVHMRLPPGLLVEIDDLAVLDG